MSRAAITLMLLATFAGLVWWAADHYNSTVSRADKAEATASSLREQLKNAQGATVTVTQYVDRERVIREKGDTIVKEIPRYVPMQADAACVVPRGFVRMHDTAAAGSLPDSDSGSLDAAPSGVALSAVAGTVAGNYTDSLANSEQLSTLQQVLRDQGVTVIGEGAP
ncbi:hypothetical protein [Ralstonia solanacearum]|uniref:hypothetical protein n=1 Tax=Ralstonia pseudosolanacearum TaxID=1310165 RepID=UPI0008FC586D|nr:hypothetical protein BL243_07935 [Ralstonia solanacearum]